jgi:cation-transporting ATPase E
MRVLAFARMQQEPQDEQISAADPIAFIVMSDKIRGDIEETLQSFRDEHISLKVISGDNLETVRAIAAQSGMDVTGAYTGDELNEMSDEELTGVVDKANVFARVEPGTKRRIVSALQTNKEYVAMVGDGVNDVPALKQADLAIVMNDGTQISKDVADIVLLNNAMSTLPRAFVEGTSITQTIFGSMKLFLVRNVYNISLFIFVMFMSLPFPITPVQISWATFGTINIPATFLAAGWFRPKKMIDFRDDVLDYVITGGVIGAVLLTILYVVVYFGTGRDVTSVRSAVTIFTALYNAYIVMTVKGVNFYKPKTFITYWKTVLMMTVLTILTVWAMYILPGLFEFKPFDLYGADWWVMPFVTLLYIASIMLLPHGMKYRYLLNRMWALFERDEKKVAKLVGDDNS